MATKDCNNCDVPSSRFRGSDGKCSTYHGSGKDNLLGAALDHLVGGDGDCETCGGTDQCQTCGGSSEVDED